MEKALEVAKVEDLEEGIPMSVQTEVGSVVLVNVSGQIYALEDSCSHEHIKLSEGEVDIDDLTIECYKHGSVFDLKNGNPLSLPATKPVKTFPVKVENDKVFLLLNE